MIFLIIFLILIVLIYTIDYILIDNKTRYILKSLEGLIPFYYTRGFGNTPRDIYYRFQRIFIYGKIVYNTVDFDHSSAKEIFLFQLKRLADYIEKSDRHIIAEQDVKRIRLAVKLIERGYDEYYREELDKKYPTKMSTSIYDKNSNFLELNFIPTSNQGKASWSEVKEARNKDQKAVRLGFRIIGDNIQTWWD